MVHALVLQRAVGLHLGGAVAGGFAEVACGGGGEVVEVDVAVGADGVGLAHLFAAGVGYLARVGAPAELLHTAEGQHGALVRLAFKQVGACARGLAVGKVEKERVGGCGDVGVPVLIHEVVDDHARGKREVGVVGLNGVTLVDLHDEDDLAAVGREEEVGHVALAV